MSARLGGDALPGLDRPQPLGREKAGAQYVPRLRRDEIEQAKHVLLGDGVGEVRVDADFPHVRHDQQGRVVERVGIALELRVGLDEVLLRSLVFPGEAALFPDVGVAARAAELQGRLLEGVFGPVRVGLGGLLDVEQLAEIEEMLVRGGFLRSRRAPPFADDLPRRHSRQHPTPEEKL
jgi:hypothetical protein